MRSESVEQFSSASSEMPARNAEERHGHLNHVVAFQTPVRENPESTATKFVASAFVTTAADTLKFRSGYSNRFFTTRSGQRAGLGLACAFGAVRQHGMD